MIPTYCILTKSVTTLSYSGLALQIFWSHVCIISTLYIYSTYTLFLYIRSILYRPNTLMAAEQNSTQNANTKASTSEAFLTSGTRPGTSKPLITVGLTPSPLDIPSLLDTVKDPRAGAVVFFAGTPPLSPTPPHPTPSHFCPIHLSQPYHQHTKILLPLPPLTS